MGESHDNAVADRMVRQKEIDVVSISDFQRADSEWEKNSRQRSVVL
jgi:hypothetical protein